MDRPDILGLLEAGEGDRFPPVVKGSGLEDWGDGDLVYPFDDSVQGGGWTVGASSWGHVAVMGGWGVKIWLFGEGIVFSSHKGLEEDSLMVRNGMATRVPVTMAAAVLNAYWMAHWLQPLDTATGSDSCMIDKVLGDHVTSPGQDQAVPSTSSSAGGGEPEDGDIIKGGASREHFTVQILLCAYIHVCVYLSYIYIYICIIHYVCVCLSYIFIYAYIA